MQFRQKNINGDLNEGLKAEERLVLKWQEESSKQKQKNRKSQFITIAASFAAGFSVCSLATMVNNEKDKKKKVGKKEPA